MFMSTSVSLDLLRKVVREEVRKAFLEVMLEFIPFVSQEEPEELDKALGSPQDYREEDFVDWSGE